MHCGPRSPHSSLTLMQIHSAYVRRSQKDSCLTASDTNDTSYEMFQTPKSSPPNKKDC